MYNQMYDPSAGGRVKTWKRRWFILTDNCLYYFEYTTVRTRKHLEGHCEVCGSELIVLFVYQDKEPRGIIPLENLSVKEVFFPRKPVRLDTNKRIRQ